MDHKIINISIVPFHAFLVPCTRGLYVWVTPKVRVQAAAPPPPQSMKLQGWWTLSNIKLDGNPVVMCGTKSNLADSIRFVENATPLSHDAVTSVTNAMATCILSPMVHGAR